VDKERGVTSDASTDTTSDETIYGASALDLNATALLFLAT